MSERLKFWILLGLLTFSLSMAHYMSANADNSLTFSLSPAQAQHKTTAKPKAWQSPNVQWLFKR